MHVWRIVGRLLLAIGGILVGLFLAEAIARFAVGENYPVEMAARPWDEVQFTMRRGTQQQFEGTAVTYDADGFRQELPAGETDRTVLVVGDSFALGYGVGDGASFPAQIEIALRRSGLRAHVLNAGVQGFGTAQEFRLMRQLLAARRIDAVVFQVFPYNDLAENREDGHFESTNDALVEHETPVVSWYVAPWRRLGEVWPEWTRSKALAVLANAMFAHARAQPPGDDGVRLERALLAAVVEAARRQGVPVLLALVGEIHECRAMTDPHLEPGDPYPAVRGWIGELGAPAIELCTVTARPEHFRPGDGHYTVAGNVVVGEALARRLAPLLSASPGK